MRRPHSSPTLPRARHARPLWRRATSGFTLLEVLIAFMVVAFGLLGLAKMQALSVGGGQVSRSRAIVATRTASLAAAMHSNRAYWAATPPASFTVGLATVASPPALASVQASCTGTASGTTPSCTATQMAAYDIQSWAKSMSDVLSSFSATGTCTAATGSTPTRCVINVTWLEKYASSSAQAASSSDATAGARTYTLYVEP